MKLVEENKKFANDEEYFLYEESSELKHELINGNLYEMSGSSIYHNKLERRIANLIERLLKQNELEVLTEGFKVRTPDNNFFYPDVIVCTNNLKRYFTNEPVLLVEVLSESTRKFDLTDKFIQYQKIPTLQYYLCVEPEQQVIIFYFKTESGEWMTETFTKDESIINLPALGISFSVKDVYKNA
ncbi:Uma2 family endonuclease [Parafilimonas terrae]|uniref:Endonuclease, Uma2 family (Restriction endonuclease fold) n=1 Tax=Parafilimonas terrae TaxID=1465490 RepID=A0A1I5RYL6_9BACT|nr:Uma2 family endonuclease [Parafilimonas terrae]SFP63540.1 Endonuclease, Uma2 family (restriction endonuclease fold) [Parafilimonas terrae]